MYRMSLPFSSVCVCLRVSRSIHRVAAQLCCLREPQRAAALCERVCEWECSLPCSHPCHHRSVINQSRCFFCQVVSASCPRQNNTTTFVCCCFNRTFSMHRCNRCDGIHSPLSSPHGMMPVAQPDRPTWPSNLTAVRLVTCDNARYDIGSILQLLLLHPSKKPFTSSPVHAFHQLLIYQSSILGKEKKSSISNNIHRLSILPPTASFIIMITICLQR